MTNTWITEKWHTFLLDYYNYIKKWLSYSVLVL